MAHRIQHPHVKGGAAKKSLHLKKAPTGSLHRHDKIVYCLWQRCVGTIKSKLRVSKGPR